MIYRFYYQGGEDHLDPYGSIDHQPSAKMCFVAIRSLGRAKRMSQCRMFKFMAIAMQRERNRRTIACIKAVSCS